MSIFLIVQRCIRVTLCGWFFSVLSLSLIAETNGELLDRVEDDTDRWIELQRSLAKENSEWKSEKELLLNSIRILNTEKGIVEKTLESNRLASEQYINNEASLKGRIDAQKKALEVISNVLEAHQEKVDSIIVRLPEPLRSEIEALALKLKPNEEEASTVAGRMQSLISILTMIDQFNKSLTLTHQIRKDPNGLEIDTRVLYWGLSVGYAVDAKGELAWRLIPNGDGWAWEDASSEAASIQAMLDIYENDRRPSLVPLRATLNQIQATMSVRKSRISTFLAGCLSVLFSMGLATAQPSGKVVRLAEEMDRLVGDSLTAYNEAVEKIADEKTPLVKEVGELERGNIALRSELKRYQRIVDEGKAAVEKMNTELLELESQTQYIERMLEEYLSKFESRIHLAEDQQFKPALSKIRISLSDKPGDTAGRFEQYGEVLGLGIERQDESFGGYAFNGKAIDSEGMVRSGKVAVLGPSAYFVSDDASTGGFLRFHSGTIEPGLAELSADQLSGLANFVSGKEGAVPFDSSLGDALALDASSLTLMEQVKQGGIVGYFIIALGVVAALLSVVKLTDLSRFSSSFPGNLEVIAAKARDESVDDAMAVSGAQGVIREMLEMGVRNINANTVLLEEMMLSIILKRRPEMERFLPFLAITAAASPLLGLLGTVVGMIKTFALITVFGTGDPQALSSGISEALVTTELGLVVAIPTLVLHGLFTRMVRSRVSVMEQIAFEFAKIASSKESQPASQMEGFSLQLFWSTIVSGGPIMFLLALLSLALYSNIIGLLLFIKRVDLEAIEGGGSDRRKRGAMETQVEEIEAAFVKYENSLMQFRHFIQSRLKYTHALLIAAPLLGLLGTVVGMLDTFRGLSLQAGFETMRLVAEGVHRALITTQTGLVIAIPALFLIYLVRRVSKKRELELLQMKIEAFGRQLEDGPYA